MKHRPLELLEESLQILRTGSAGILILYWTGSLPFVISLLLLLRDTSFSWGGTLLFRDSLVCGVAFLWMSYWKSVASSSTLLLLSPDADSVRSWAARLTVQAVFQTLKLFVMPLAIASLFAWPAASSFFRTLSLEPLSGARPIRSGLQRAFATAGDNYRQNSVAFLTVAGFSVITFLNVLIAFALTPTLWKMLTGYETDWSRLENSGAIFSLFSVAAIATWLLIDPWLQTYSILRVFYRNARSDGRDLLRDLSRLAAVGIICALCFCSPAAAQQQQQDALDHSIARASQDVNYGWLHPAESQPSNGFFGNLAKTVRDAYNSARGHLKSWYRSVAHWLRDLFGNRNTTPEDSKKSKPRSQELRWTLAILAVLVCGLIVALMLRSVKTRAVPSGSASAAAAPAADILNEQLLASDVSQEEWMRLAFEYLSNNQSRLAARAFYLANLSYLGAKSLLSLSLWKSNRLYERELARQPHSSELSSAFVAGNRLYELAWFGMRELGVDQLELLKGAADKLRQHA